MRHCCSVALYAKKDLDKYKHLIVPCHFQTASVMRRNLAPKRRCSSHTFRYGYLVTT